MKPVGSFNRRHGAQIVPRKPTSVTDLLNDVRDDAFFCLEALIDFGCC